MIKFKPGSYGHIAQNNIEVAFDNAGNHPNASGVYSQQAVETMLKQYLSEVQSCTDNALLRSHSLRKLASAAGLAGLTPYIQQLWELTDVYYSTRYPGEDYCELTPEQASSLHLVAAAILDIISTEIAKFRV